LIFSKVLNKFSDISKIFSFGLTQASIFFNSLIVLFFQLLKVLSTDFLYSKNSQLLSIVLFISSSLILNLLNQGLNSSNNCDLKFGHTEKYSDNLSKSQFGIHHCK